MSYSAEVQADSPLLYWKLDETGAADFMGGPSWPFGSGVVGGGSPLPSDGGTSVHGGGADAIARRSSIPSSLAGSSVSWAGWVDIPAANVAGAFQTIGTNTSNGWGVGVGGTSFDNTGKQLILLHEGVAWKTTGHNLSTGKHRVVVTRSSADLFKAYVDGSLVWSGTFTPTAPTGSMNLGGTSSTARALSSTVQVDDAQWFASELSAAWVTSDYNGGAGDASVVAGASPVIWLKLNETSTSSTTAADATGSSRTGTHTGTVSIEQPSLLGDGSGFSALYDGGYTTIASASWMNTTTVAVECRYKPRSADLSGSKPIATRWVPSGEAWILWVNAGKVEAYVWTTSGQKGPCVGATTLIAGTKYTVGMSYDGANIKVLVNGAVDGTLAATGNLRTVSAPIEIGRVSLATAGGGTVDEFSVMPASMADARFATRHAAAIAAGTSVASVGNPAGVVATPTASGSVPNPAAVTTAASAAAAVPNPAATSADVVPTASVPNPAGVVVTDVPAVIVAVAGVENPAGVSAAPTAAAAVPNAAAVAASALATAAVPNPAHVDAQPPSFNDASIGIEIGLDAVSQSIELASSTASIGVAVGLHAESMTVAMSGASIGVAVGLRALTKPLWTRDPRSGRAQLQLRVTDDAGTASMDVAPVAEMGETTWQQNKPEEFAFSLPFGTPEALAVTPKAGHTWPMVQLYRGQRILNWFDVLKATPSQDGARVEFTCAQRDWALEREHVGKMPPRNLLRNPDFATGTTAGWSFGWEPNSVPAAAPEHRVVDDEFTVSGKAIELEGVDKVVTVKQAVEAAAVFVPNSSAYLSGGEAAIEDVGDDIPDDSSVHIVGHTANDGTGDGMALSLARANAAKATLLAQNSTLSITTEGRGFYEPVATNSTEAGRKQNRRVEISYSGIQTAKGHRQRMLQIVQINHPTSAQSKLPVTAAGWFKITEFIEKSKEGYGVLLQLVKKSAPTKVLTSASSTIDETTPRGRWTYAEATVEIPADGQDYLLYVKYYPPAGTIRWTRLGVWPDDQLGFFDVDQATIVRKLVEHAQDPAMGRASLGLETRTPATGVVRTKEWKYRDHNQIAGLIESLGALHRGVDTSLLVSPTRRIFRTHFSQRGGISDVVLAVGHNLLWLDAPVDVTQTATALIVQADSIGQHREESYVKDTRALGGKVLESVISADGETPLNELDEVATEALRRRGAPVVFLTAAADPAYTDEILERLEHGDTCRVIDERQGIDVTARWVGGRHNLLTDGLTLSLTREV